jgi:hypothetical protein
VIIPGRHVSLATSSPVVSAFYAHLLASATISH